MAKWEVYTTNSAYRTRIKEFEIEVSRDSYEEKYWVSWWLHEEGFEHKTLHGRLPIERATDIEKAKKEGLYVFRNWFAKWVYEVNKELPPPRRELRENVGSAFNDFLPRCDNCYKRLGENAVGRMAFPGKRFCSEKCAEEYSE